jgi:hypothetical protein
MNLVPTQKSQEERRTNKKENKVIGFLVIRRLLIKHKVSMYPFKFDIHIITVYPKYTTIDQSGLDSNQPDEKIHFGVVWEEMDMMMARSLLLAV